MLLLLALAAIAPAASALHTIDFEQPYYVHPGMQVWDFCLIHHDGLYQIFYHGIPETDPTPAAAKHIWRATSEDLIHWSEPDIVLSVTPAWYEANAVWAPDVIYSEAAGLWYMAYTGVDDQMNQRICLAWSNDLVRWGRLFGNPLIVPDPETFYYEPGNGWAECRDPYIFYNGGLWHLLATTRARQPGPDPGALMRTTSSSFHSWSNGEVFMVNDGDAPGRVLESSTYLERDGTYHLFFHEGGIHGVKHIWSDDPDNFTMDRSAWLGPGIAPEVDTFDGGQSYLISRIGQFQVHPDSVVQQVAHVDTLVFGEAGPHPQVAGTHPLSREFAHRSGSAAWGNPVLGDNPVRRGDPTVGLVGHGYLGTAEFFQGPLGFGSPGGDLGDEGLITLRSHPFPVTGNSLSLLIGGSDTHDCYVALRDAQTDSLLRVAYPWGNATMERYQWDIRSLQGRQIYVEIVDADTLGHLNVDDIRESLDEPPVAVSSVPAASPIEDLGPRPNPFNPRTELRFALARDASYRVRLHDLRGRLVWDSGERAGQRGPNTVVWDGMGTGGDPAPGGVYVYRIQAAGAAISGKVTLLP
jgi:hypothetical protein